MADTQMTTNRKLGRTGEASRQGAERLHYLLIHILSTKWINAWPRENQTILCSGQQWTSRARDLRDVS